MENSKERKIYICLLLILCLISMGLVYYIYKHEYSQEIRPVPINESITLNATPIVPQDITITNNYVGYVEAINQVQIIPYINGYIQNVEVKAGQFIQKGDLILTIEPEEYKARVEASEAAVMQASASFEYNQNYYERVQKSGKKAFSEIEIDNAKNNFLQAQATLKNAEANKLLATVNYNYTIINAPISGLIGNFTLSSGDYVSPSSGSLLNIIQTNPIRVVFSLTDVEYFNMKENGQLFKDSVIHLKLPNGKIYKHTGKFKYTNNELNKSTNSLAIYVYFENEDNELLPNAFVTVNIDKIFKNSVSIDKKYIKMQTDGNFINLSQNGKIILKPVEILGEKGTQYILKNTFTPDDLLILDDVSSLKKNAKIDFKIVK